MRLSWNEIRTREAKFVREREGEGYEKGRTQLFCRDFSDVFAALHKAVDQLCRRKKFAFERERVEHLFDLYE